MDKIAKVPHLREELDWLDQTYGVEKEDFFIRSTGSCLLRSC